MRLWAILAVIAWASVAQGQAFYLPLRVTGSSGGYAPGNCTDGVNCLCDHPSITSDSTIVLCEDLEDLDYYATNDWATGFGSGNEHDRGSASDWVARYGAATSGGSGFQGDDPSPARVGTTCGSGLVPSAECSGPAEFCSAAQGALVDGGGANCWEVNAYAGMDIQRSGDFDEPLGTLTLTGGNIGAGDVFDGKAHFSYIVPESPNITNGEGTETFSSGTEFGITMALAYGSNTGTNSIISQPWKHEEWTGSGVVSEHWNLGLTGALYSSTYFPYQPFMWANNATDCAAAVINATAHVGGVACAPGAPAIGLTANGVNAYPNDNYPTHYKLSGETAYDRAADFPFGTWGCHKAHISGMGTTNLRIRLWHNEVLVVDVEGIDGTKLRNQNYSSYWFNAYSNAANLDITTADGFRYWDNLVIRRGTGPLACNAIGFVGL